MNKEDFEIFIVFKNNDFLVGYFTICKKETINPYKDYALNGYDVYRIDPEFIFTNDIELNIDSILMFLTEGKDKLDKNNYTKLNFNKAENISVKEPENCICIKVIKKKGV